MVAVQFIRDVPYVLHGFQPSHLPHVGLNHDQGLQLRMFTFDIVVSWCVAIPTSNTLVS